MSEAIPAIDAAKAAFQKRLDGGLRPVEIPEWPQPDGSPTVLYVGPENVQQKDEYYSLVRDNKLQGFVKLLIVRLKKRDGKRAFAPSDEIALMKEADPSVIVDIVLRIDKVMGEEVPVDTAGKS